MSEILFVIGAGIMLVGELRLGTFQASGMQVRVAGFLLTMPLVVRYFLSFVLAGFMDDPADVVGGVEFLTLFVATGVAYGLVYRTSGTQLAELFNIENLTNRERHGEAKDEVDTAPEEKTPSGSTGDQPSESPVPTQQVQPKTPPQPKPNRPTPLRRAQANAPSVLSLAEAASYLNISETALIKLINDGEIPAARINYRYKISKAVLDEFLKKQQDGEA